MAGRLWSAPWKITFAPTAWPSGAGIVRSRKRWQVFRSHAGSISIDATPEMRSTALGLRGFFLADPDELSLLALVDQFAEEETPGQGRMYRIDGGNDSLVTALAAPFADRIRPQTALVSVIQSSHGIDATVRASDGLLSTLHADYLICTLPATALKVVQIDPPLPLSQLEAIRQLPYGPATRTALQFEQTTWRKAGKPRAYGTDLPIGAVWDGNEEQKGPAGILTLLAGGSASAATRRLLSSGGVDEVLKHLDWLPLGRTRLTTHRVFSWEDDPWSGGGYAYFSPSYDPSWRAWLARPAQRSAVCRRAHQLPMARVNEWCRGKRAEGRRRSKGARAPFDSTLWTFGVKSASRGGLTCAERE